MRQDKSIAKECFGKASDNGDQQGCDAYRKLHEIPSERLDKLVIDGAQNNLIDHDEQERIREAQKLLADIWIYPRGNRWRDGYDDHKSHNAISK